MSGPHRNPDKLNSIGIVVVGICGAVLVYVSIVALQAFYMNDTSEVQTMADYGGQDTTAKSLRAQQMENLQRFAPQAAPQAPKEGPTPPQTYTISIDDAIPLVVRSAKQDPSNLVPAIGRAVTPSVKPIFGRPHLLNEPAPGAGSAAPAGAAPAGTEGAGAGSSAPMTPTGGQGPGGGPPPGTEGQLLQNPSGAPTKTEPAKTPPKNEPAAPPKIGPAQPKAGGTAPAQPKAGGTTPAQPKGGAAPKQPAPAPAQPKKGNAS
jgi:hypothetical protein